MKALTDSARLRMCDDFMDHMLEQVLNKMKVGHELVAEIPRIARKLDRVEHDLKELKHEKKGYL